MKLALAEEMRRLELAATEECRIPSLILMENAGRGTVDAMVAHFGELTGRVVAIVVGPGNNGGDTLIALTELASEGWKASACLVKRKKDDLVKRFTDAGGEIITGESSFEKLSERIETADVLLDGILGTGIQMPLKKDVAELLSEVNNILEGWTKVRS